MTLTMALAILSAMNMGMGLLRAYTSPRGDVKWIVNMLGGLWIMLVILYTRGTP